MRGAAAPDLTHPQLTPCPALAAGNPWRSSLTPSANELPNASLSKPRSGRDALGGLCCVLSAVPTCSQNQCLSRMEISGVTNGAESGEVALSPCLSPWQGMVR